MNYIKSKFANFHMSASTKLTTFFLLSLILVTLAYISSISARKTISDFTSSQLGKLKKTTTYPIYLDNVLAPSVPYRPHVNQKKYNEHTPLILEDSVNKLPKLKELAAKYNDKYLDSDRVELIKLYDNTKNSVYNQYLMKQKLLKYENEKQNYYDANKSNSLIR